MKDCGFDTCRFQSECELTEEFAHSVDADDFYYVKGMERCLWMRDDDVPVETYSKEPKEFKWTMIRRYDRDALVEYICPHGIGHPAYGSALWIAEEKTAAGYDTSVRAELTHGCDGCCGRSDFPGDAKKSLVRSHEIIRDLQRALGAR